MTKPSLDTTKPLVMARFKTVLGHNLNPGTPLAIVEEPKAPGEVDQALAARLWNSGAAAYLDEHRPTPVETPEQEKARLAAEALRDGEDEAGVPADLLVWQADDAETGKKKSQKVTNSDLVAIAAREGAVVETDDNKADLTRKIMIRRAAALGGFPTNSESGQGPDAGSGDSAGSTAPVGGEGADTGADGGDD